MQIFAGEYLQDREKASCGCKFLKESICKIEKREVADENSHILTEKNICKSTIKIRKNISRLFLQKEDFI